MGCLRFERTSTSLKKKKAGKGEEFRKGELSMQVPQELRVSYSLENPSKSVPKAEILSASEEEAGWKI